MADPIPNPLPAAFFSGGGKLTDGSLSASVNRAASAGGSARARLRAQGNLALSGEQTIDGVLTSADRVLVALQSAGSEDGIYVTAAGAWARASDFPAGLEARGFQVWIEEGSVDGGKLFVNQDTEGSDVVGTDDLTFGQIGAGSPRGAGAGTVLNVNDIDVANADGSITVNADNILVGVLQSDAQHGVRGGGTQHADVVAAGADGFMTGADKTKLDALEEFTPIVVDATTSRSLTDADNGKIIRFTNGSPVTVTVPAALTLGFGVALVQQGVGKVSLAAGGTLTFVKPATAASPPATAEQGALIAVSLIDDTGSAELALAYGRLE